jgi:hypothetical protein
MAASIEQSSSNVKKKRTLVDHFGVHQEIASARRDVQSINVELARALEHGAVGWIPTEEDDNIGCFIFENYKSLAVWKNLHKVHELNKLLRKYDADCALGVELQVQWDEAHKIDKGLSLDKILLPGWDKRTVVSYSISTRTSTARSTEAPVLQPSIDCHSLYRALEPTLMALVDMELDPSGSWRDINSYCLRLPPMLH